ncbi:hypothetical protein COY15_00540 [Candidatus Roizmanbacteria bacterium CG_4_10_14_0_2_um_filter_39_12]|nr:MAG: hypothetical protein COY15_00540 [Candidatus Roizmanbacteria bacterium CG_4_10_14_0_2_um_filter_39_12]
MKKEYFLVTALAFFGLAYVLDYFAGPVSFLLTTPLTFLTKTYLNSYPLTAFAVVIRALGIFISLLLLFSMIEKQYFVKAFTIFVIAVLVELYAVQQIATGMRTTSIQWTLSISYAGIILISAIIFYIIAGIIDSLRQKLKKDDTTDEKSNTI